MNSFRKFIPLILTVAVLLIVLIVVLPQFADYESAFDTLGSLSTRDLLIIFGFTVLNITVYVLPFLVAMPGMKYWPAFMIRQTSFLISNGIPGGGTIGVGVQYAMSAGYGHKGSEASSGIIITSLWNMLATISLPGIAVLLVLLTGQRNDENIWVGVVGIIVAIVAVGSYAMLFRSKHMSHKIASWIESIYEKIRNTYKKLPKMTITKSLMDFREATYKTTLKRWRSLASTNYLQQLCQFLVLYVTIDILQPGAISFLLALSAFAFARIGTFIPLTPGGLGTVDAILVSLLVSGGVDNEVALAATLVWRAATYFPQLGIGLVTFLMWRFKSNKA